MSLFSEQDPSALTGRVILGPGSGPAAETTILELETRQSPIQFEEVEARFWERVRAKAKARAAAIIADAMAEAQRLKAASRDEGYNEGLAAGSVVAHEHSEAELTRMAASFGSLMQSLAGERTKIWDAQRQDFLRLLRLAVERTIGSELDGRRQEILANLLGESLELMESKAELTLTIHPDDEIFLRDLLVRAQVEYPSLGQVQLRLNPTLVPGSILLEGQEGLVDNTVGSRFAQVEAILTQMGATGDSNDRADPAA